MTEQTKKCSCTDGACSLCYSGEVTELPMRSDEERYKAHVEMERQAHAQERDGQ
jgi:hypothetical protein